ncbi:methyltransferase [Acidobacteriota bacterium]
MSKNPQAQKIFDEGMTGASTLSDFAIINAYDFSAFKTIADVGGGHGFILGILLDIFPELRGVLFDLPSTIDYVIENKMFEKKNFSKRVNCIGGSFFESVPAGYDAYLLKFILRDWEDKKAGKILANCRKAMRDDSVLIIVGNMAEDKKNKADFSKLLDIALMSATGGRVRTMSESIKLLEDSGFKLKRAIPTASIFTILEAVPA